MTIVEGVGMRYLTSRSSGSQKFMLVRTRGFVLWCCVSALAMLPIVMTGQVLPNESVNPPLTPPYGQTSQSDPSANKQYNGVQNKNIPTSDPIGQSQDDTAASENTADQVTMSADEIIEILRQRPDVLSAVKEVIAQQKGVDASTISDDDLYAKIRQDASVRAQLTKQLNQMGYETTSPDRAGSQDKGISTSAKDGRNGTNPQRTDTLNQQGDRDQNEPQVKRRTNPYGNLPSLSDLYAQLPATGGELHRFGSDVFYKDNGKPNGMPMDVPVGPDYVLGSGDTLIVNMWGGKTAQLNRVIDRQGQINLPEAGTIAIAGLTVGQAQDAIGKALATQFQNVHVELSVAKLRSVRVYVVGDVQRPGAYDVSSLSTPLSALYEAGGPTSRGSLRLLKQYRGKELVREFDLYDFLLKGVRSVTDRLQAGDTLLVPPVGAQVSVAGVVRRPAIYELKDERGLSDVLDLAGGPLVSANLKQIRVERIEAHERRTMLSLQLPEVDGSAVSGFKVQDGDSVLVSQILPYNQQAVYLEGHVFRPGKYPYREGMTAADLLLSYQEVMPEPSDHAELIRLRAPDFRPETTSFNLRDVLIGNAVLQLQPFDLIRVYGRYEADPPYVSIFGEVLRPGKYPLGSGMTASILLQAAGGFKRSAFRDEADVTSYKVEGGEQVVLDHHVIAIDKAANGDKAADLSLKPGDVVSIRQLAGWDDIGASISVNGEVAHPGTYGIQVGERLSTILKRAGGFRPDAFPAGAVLERIQVRALAEHAREEMIQRLETTPVGVAGGIESGTEQAALAKSAEEQRQQILTSLRNHPAKGRQVIRISGNISEWENTPADIEVRNGDTLSIPKGPNFVITSGEVYNATAISFVPGKTVIWYLNKAGGITPSGNKSALFVLRADGSVVGRGGGWMSGNVKNLRMQPGDSIIVPEKILSGSQTWKNVVAIAQIMSSIAITGAVAGIF